MPWRRVDEQDDALARGQAARHLVPEVDVAGRVDQVDDVVVPLEPHVLGLDGDAPLALEVHRVEVLGPHVAGVDGAGELEEAVGERRLPVVDVGDDAEVAEPVEPGHTPFSPPRGRWDETPAPAASLSRSLECPSSTPEHCTRHGEHQEPDQAEPLERAAAPAQPGRALRAEDAHQDARPRRSRPAPTTRPRPSAWRRSASARPRPRAASTRTRPPGAPRAS